MSGITVMPNATHLKLGDLSEVSTKCFSGPRISNLLEIDESEAPSEPTAASAELERLRAEVAELRRSHALAAQAASRGDAAAAAAALASGDTATNGIAVATSPSPPPPDASPSGFGGSEGRLRVVLTSRSSTSAELRQAIGAVEALLEEAKRELAAKELRERRAAFEALHVAMDARNEKSLPDAISEARRTGCDDEDVEKAEGILKELQSLTDEERRAKEIREAMKEKKSEAFLCVKRDNAEKLAAILAELPEGMRWQEWRDHAQRTLWRCSQDLRAEKVKTVLGPLLGMSQDSPKSGRRNRRKKSTRKSSMEGSEGNSPTSPASATAFSVPSLPAQSATGSFTASPPSSPGRERRPRSPSLRFAVELSAGPAESAEDAFSRGFHVTLTNGSMAVSEFASSPGSPLSISGMSPQKPTETDEEKIMKAKAFRAVAHNDVDSLQEVFDAWDIESIKRWQNKAGETLLVLSEKRKSYLYAMLAKALGIVCEQKRDAYEEKQAVWVYFVGDPQPRQATVLEDTPEEADTVLLEFWNGDDPPERIDKGRVRPSWS